MWRLFLACTPEPDTGECPEPCGVTLEVVPPSGLTGALTVRTDPPGYAFGGSLLDPSGAEIVSIDGLSEAEVELLAGDLVAGETYTVSMGYACEPGSAQPVCARLEATFVAGAAGTGGTTTTTTTPAGVTDVTFQALQAEVDVLFVVDNSCSMANEQQTLVENFPWFVSYFVGSGLDYHIGVVNTDIDGNYNGSKGKLREVGGERWIDGETLDPIAVFGAMASMGTSGSGTEKGIGATYQALETNAGGYNQGFLRDTSGIHVVVVSDEPDLTPAAVITQPEFVDWFDGLRNDSELRTFSSIVGPLGTKYANTTQEIGGVVHDISDDDYGPVLEALGIQASGLKREFFLSQVPVPNTIEVWVEDLTGATFEFTRDDDYLYSADRNSVTFVEYVPNSGAAVVVHYLPAD